MAKLALKIGLAFVFLYAGVSCILSPDDWVWFIPEWIPEILPREMMLLGHAIFEIGLGVWLLLGWRGFLAASIAALDLFIITVVNLEILGVVFRDVGLFFMALALAFLSKVSKK